MRGNLSKGTKCFQLKQDYNGQRTSTLSHSVLHAQLQLTTFSLALYLWENVAFNSSTILKSTLMASNMADVS